MASVEEAIRLDYQHHSRLSELDLLVYPVVSRRAGGLSLGVNLNPDKRCNFDCVYCQVDRRTLPDVRQLDLGQLEGELRHWLERIGEAGYRGYPLRDIGLAGDGEPSLVRSLPRVLQLLLELKQEGRVGPEVGLVLFTNGSGLGRTDLAPLWPDFFAAGGAVWWKFDAWDEASLARINRSRVDFARLRERLYHFAQSWPVVLQSCFCQWQGRAFDLRDYEAYGDALSELLDAGCRIEKIQAYTLARAPAEAEARPWPDAAMEALGERLRVRLDLPVEVYGAGGQR